ncbi:MAG: GntR family transcriptional regulator [Gemmatimonadaceae bacterium]
MLISLDPQDTRPIYVQIVDEVRRALVLGTLGADNPLPSVRDLAVQLRVNPNTVSQAYRDLERQGMVYVRRGQGTYASPGQSDGSQRQTLAEEVARRALHDAWRNGLTAAELIGAIRNEDHKHPTEEPL